jgi:hypothetical protein
MACVVIESNLQSLYHSIGRYARPSVLLILVKRETVVVFGLVSATVTILIYASRRGCVHCVSYSILMFSEVQRDERKVECGCVQGQSQAAVPHCGLMQKAR